MPTLVDHIIGNYEDSFQPTGGVKGFPPHFEWKKLHHDLHIVIDGPANGMSAALDCLNKAVGAGLLAGVLAAFGTGGLAAANVAFAAASASFTTCLGNQYQVRLNDSSYWITWWT